MTFLYGRAGRLNTENAGFRPGQTSTAVFGAAEMPEVRVMRLAPPRGRRNRPLKTRRAVRTSQGSSS